MPDLFAQHQDTQRKGGAVPPGYQGAAFYACSGIKIFHLENACMISLATTSPDIRLGGTPGPGTVNWPEKYKFFTFLLRKEGFKMAVCHRVFASP
jgi:hypothetical protein